MLGLFKRLFDDNAKHLRRYEAAVRRINELEPEIENLSDQELAAKTVAFRERLDQGAELDDLCHEAFAVVREAAKRTLGMRHFDVQLIGGLALHEGNVAEMKTGEGKTLVATLPAYLNALTGRGVHVVTVNDYLARRDSEWMGQIFRFLGLSVGVIVHGLDPAQRRRAYHADITYATNNEIGFDYLRDNMALYREQLVQRDLHYAIIDEVDSILIDEARTPLIISGQVEKPVAIYKQYAQIARQLKKDLHYTVDEKARAVMLTEAGVAAVEKMLGIDNLSDLENVDHKHGIDNALKAKELYKRDVQYVVNDGRVIIVDEFTGRLMPGRRYSDGLHQAIEAKENVTIERESQTLASITFQNLFRSYEKLAGMTGTAATEADEFRQIYGLDVIVIPTHKPMIRRDHPDIVYLTERAKFDAVINDILTEHERGRPVLVGTVSIEKSEQISRELKKRGIAHQVLNAKYHEQEAAIIAQAGRLGAVTIATNMAGRGTDIMLGGNPDYLAREALQQEGYASDVIAVAAEKTPTDDPEVLKARERYRALYEQFAAQTEREREAVLAAGGLHIIGTERHESRRIDNQLRGRAGRQGDPGSSRFYVSLEDDLMRLFGSDNIRGLIDRLGVREDEPIESGLVTRAIENAQKKVESRNFSIRKNLLEFDDVLNQQRKIIYEQRRQVLNGEPLAEHIHDMFEAVAEQIVAPFIAGEAHPEDWDLDGLLQYVRAEYLPQASLPAFDLETLDAATLQQWLVDAFAAEHRAKEAQLGAEAMRELERVVLLRVVDSKWMEHLAAIDDLRDGIGLRAYGQRNPLLEYRKEAFDMFQAMIASIQDDVVKLLMRLQVQPAGEGLQRRRVAQVDQARQAPLPAAAAVGGSYAPPPQEGAGGGRPPAKPQPVIRAEKIGRNDPCPCGSGKKYKKCHGR